MADPVTPQLREKVIERLRELTSTRNVPRSPEEIERLIMDKSNGMKKPYMNLFSKVINSGGASSGSSRDHGSSSPTVMPSNVRPVVSGTRAGPGLLPPQQQQQSVGASQGHPHQQHQPAQVIHMMPLTSTGTGAGTASVATTHGLPPNRPHLQASPGQPKSAVVNQAASTASYVNMDPNGQRITIQPGITTNMLNQIPPRVMVVQSRGSGKLLHRFVRLPSYGRPASDHFLPQKQAGVALSMVAPGAPALTPSAAGGSQLTTAAGQQQQQQPTGGGPYVLSTSTGAPFSSNIQGTPVTTGHTTNYPTEKYGGGPVTVFRSVEPTTSTNMAPVSVPSASSAAAGDSLAPVSSQPRGSVRGTATTVVSTTTAQQMMPPSSTAPAPTVSGGTAAVSYRTSSQGSGSSHSTKPPVEPLTPEMRAQIVAGLSKMAGRYLPAVRRAIHRVTEQPSPIQQQGVESAQRKYVKLKEILENPETNLTGIRPDQLPCIEKLLNEIERNPLHLVQSPGHSHRQHHNQQQQQQQQQSQQQQQISRFGPSQQQQQRLTGDAQARSAGEQQQFIAMQSQQISPQSQVLPPGSGGTVNRFRAQQTPTGNDQLASLADGAGGRLSSSACRAPGAVAAAADNQEDISHGLVAMGQQQGQPPQRLPSTGTLFLPMTGGGGVPGPHDFANSLKALAEEFKLLASGPQGHSEQQPGGSSGGGEQLRRLQRAIGEIAQETKAFRESQGLLLAQDLLSQWSPARLTGSGGSGSGIGRGQLIDTADDDKVDIVSTGTGGEPGELLPATKTPDVAPDDHDGADEELVDRAASPTRKRQLSLSSSGRYGDPVAGIEMDVAEPKEKRQRTGSSDWSLKFDVHKSRSSVKTVATKQETHELPKHLFLDNAGITDDPKADPLTRFPADQLDRLNPRVLGEVEQIRLHLRLPIEANTSPPPVDVMETYSTCLDYGEWNASCHLVICRQSAGVVGGVPNAEEDSPMACLPCSPPPLFIRLSPDYLVPATPGEGGHQLNWYYPPEGSVREPESSSSSSWVGATRCCPPRLSESEQARFLHLCYLELNRSLGCRVSSSHHRPCHRYVSLYQLAKAWLDCLCAAMARFVNFDESIQSVLPGPPGTLCTSAF